MGPPQRALRILMTCDAVGGVWVYATNLARSFARQGHRVHLVTLGPAPSEDQRESIAHVSGVSLEITDLALEWIDPEGVDTSRAAVRLRAIERSFRPDIIHLNGYREALIGWSAPVLCVAHSDVRSWWLACRGGEPDGAQWERYVGNVEAGLAAATAWAAPTFAFAETVGRLYDPPRPAHVIHNGVEPSRPAGAKAPIVLTAGRLWDEAKNIATVAGAASSLKWPVLVAGDMGANGPHDAENLCWLGQVPRGALLDQMRRAAIFVSPARYEPFGLAVLEAAQRGCALVLSDIPTLRELWVGAAAFVDPVNPQALAETINRIVADDVLRLRLQRAAAERARQYTLSAQARAYLHLYADMLGLSDAPAAQPTPALECVT